MDWLQARPLQDLAATTIALTEIEVGLARMPESRQQFNLQAKFQAFVVRAGSGLRSSGSM
jgi:hypothetical protein